MERHYRSRTDRHPAVNPVQLTLRRDMEDRGELVVHGNTSRLMPRNMVNYNIVFVILRLEEVDVARFDRACDEVWYELSTIIHTSGYSIVKPSYEMQLEPRVGMRKDEGWVTMTDAQFAQLRIPEDISADEKYEIKKAVVNKARAISGWEFGNIMKLTCWLLPHTVFWQDHKEFMSSGFSIRALDPAYANTLIFPASKYVEGSKKGHDHAFHWFAFFYMDAEGHTTCEFLPNPWSRRVTMVPDSEPLLCLTLT